MPDIECPLRTPVRNGSSTPRLLGLAELRDKGIRLSRVHLSRLVKAGHFPAPIKLGIGKSARVAWVESEVDAWIAAKMAARAG